ncbi:MAG: type 4a pilus biogenesis protein PilO [Nitrospiria bacterium]
MAIDVETIKSLTSKQKLVLLFMICVAVVSSFIWFVFIPKNEEIHRLDRDISTLNNEINVLRIKVRRLAQLKQENLKLQRKLKEMKEQLPPEAEVEFLLKQVSDLGGGSGLDFKLWRPGPKVVNASGLYTEIPVSIEVAGGYHSVGVFFDKISKMRRIINISNIRMSSPKIVRNQVMIQTSFSATAFASAEKAGAVK